jgi:4a-hydroxytetrahydrobiopterin dehydratase
MSGSIARARLHEIDWRVLAYAASTHFRTGTLAEGATLVDAIVRLSEATDRQPDVDLRTNGVTVRLNLNEQGELGEGNLALAGEISAVARELGVPVDLTGLQSIQIAVDALVIQDVLPFWRAVLGYEDFADVVVDAHRILPPIWFQQMDAPRPQRNRIHIDLYLPQDQAEARVAAAIAAGGRIVNAAHAPHWWTLADPEGNEVDVAPWPDRE